MHPTAAIACLVLGLSGIVSAGIDNSALIPPIVPDAKVALEGIHPDWVKSLVMAEVRIETATPEGTFASATRVLDHYAEMGVNGLWIDPVYQRGSKSNGYGNFGPGSIEPLLTGARDAEGSFAVVRHFVEEAHRRNIRVIFDIIVWGTMKNAPLVSSHPEFYRHGPDGKLVEGWNGYLFDWSNAGLRAAYRQSAVSFIRKTGADGFRVDLAPDLSDYFFGEVRAALLAEGRKCLIVSEMPGERRNAFDFEQNGITGWTEEPAIPDPAKLAEQKQRFGNRWDYPLRHNLVDIVRSGDGIGSATVQARGDGGRYRYYTANILCHDDAEQSAHGDRLTFAYAPLFGPFIPMWWIGEEWNNPKKLLPDPSAGGVMYGNTIDWAARELPENRAFFEDIKLYLRIRRSHADVFENFAPSLREANLCKIASRLDGAPNPLQAFARTGETESVVIVGNPSPSPARAEIALDPADFKAAEGSAPVVMDLIHDRPVACTPSHRFESDLPGRWLGVFLIRWEAGR